MPKSIIHTHETPVIGQLMFQTTNKNFDTDWQSENFTGWVYPNGAHYPISAFSITDEFEIIDNEFIVPIISDFIRCNPIPYEHIYTNTDYAYSMPDHKHLINMQLSGQMTGTIKYKCSGDGKGSSSHGASQQTKRLTYDIPIDYSQLSIDNMNYIKDNVESDVKETTPSYTIIQTLIYIGLPYKN